MSNLVEHIIAISIACAAFAYVARDWVRAFVGKPSRHCEGCGLMKLMDAMPRRDAPLPPSALVRRPGRTSG